MVAISLSLTIGDFDNTSSMMDDVMTYMSTGQMDILDKKSWASGMGICEISIDGHALANIYAYRYCNRIIQGLLSTSDDTIAIANNWFTPIDIRSFNHNWGISILDHLISIDSVLRPLA